MNDSEAFQAVWIDNRLGPSNKSTYLIRGVYTGNTTSQKFSKLSWWLLRENCNQSLNLVPRNRWFWYWRRSLRSATSSLRSKRFCVVSKQLLALFFARSLTLPPRSLLRNHTGPHGNASATQASHELLLSLKKAVIFRTPTFDKPSSWVQNNSATLTDTVFCNPDQSSVNQCQRPCSNVEFQISSLLLKIGK